MLHLRVGLRWLKLLSDDATEDLQGSLALRLRKDFPEPSAGYPSNRGRFRSKRVPASSRRMVLLLELC
jgi:hypothetical protein